VVIVLGIAKGRGQIQKFISEVHWFGSAATDPMEAMKDMGLGGSPATKNDIAKILAEMETYRAEKQATGEASPTDDAEQQRAAEAVADVLGDTSLQARAAADAMREGGVQDAFAILRADALSGAAETAERWRRLGALARGIDTLQTLEAYEAAFRLQPSDFVTCIELARLRTQAGNVPGALEAAEASELAAGTDRERAIGSATVADSILIQ
jgi:hypothetical protein